jgi:hypothetical protein
MHLQKISFLSLLCVMACLFSFSPLHAASDADKQGWGNEDAYNQLYSPRELDKLRGNVLRFKTLSPLPGMSKATVLILDDDGDKIEVHLCPVWFATAKDTGIKRGDRVKIKGNWAEIDGEDVFMASKVKKGEHYEFKVRLTKDGSPFWNMSAEQLAFERSQQ